jgi:hypothetical protein
MGAAVKGALAMDRFKRLPPQWRIVGVPSVTRPQVIGI